ncbi:hypothetical protein [Streptomyces albidoflavus]|uniref:hypothetical protein n=1 Tax=Streptomyces albidoflavus TaxID=1886 RepID=UPI0033A27F97
MDGVLADLTPPNWPSSAPSPYVLLARHLNRRGHQLSPGLLGDGPPERTAQVYASPPAWLRG